MSEQPRIAVIGGMGPLASAEFVSTIYERSAARPEQETPTVLLWSDPTFPDRSTALLDGRPDLLISCLQRAVEQCCDLGAEEIIVCCVTIHAVVPALPHRLRSRIVSLVDVLLSAAIEQERRLLLMTSVGTRWSGVLEDHPLWPRASRWLCWPDDEDQQRVHRAIYDIKQNTDVDAVVAMTKGLLQKYAVESFAAGCTELHMLNRRWRPRPSPCVDPLEIIANRIAASPARAASVAGAR